MMWIPEICFVLHFDFGWSQNANALRERDLGLTWVSDNDDNQLCTTRSRLAYYRIALWAHHTLLECTDLNHGNFKF